MIKGSYYLDDPLWGGWLVDAKSYLEKDFPELYRLLADSAVEFYAYGSRTMKVIPKDNTESDWDFAIDTRAEGYLEGLGFQRKEGDYDYQAISTEAVYERKLGDHTIQVAVKPSLYLFEQIWEYLDVDFWLKYIDKRSPTYLGKGSVQRFFDMQYGLAKELEEGRYNEERFL